MAEEGDNTTEYPNRDMIVPREFMQIGSMGQQEYVRNALTKVAKGNGDKLVDVSVPPGGAWTAYPVPGDDSSYLIKVTFTVEPDEEA